MGLKEYRVYVGFAENVSAYTVHVWEMADILPQEALDFIKQAEDLGSVYTLNGFQNALNFDEININNNLIFITNKY